MTHTRDTLVYYMRTTSLFSIASVLALSAGLAQADTIVGGNAAIARTNVDGFSNFSIIDRNAPITTTGALSSWSVYAGNTGSVALLIYRFDGSQYSIVNSSAMQTPVAGLNTFSLGAGFNVQAGDFVGLHLGTPSSVMFDGSGAANSMSYSNNNAGMTAVFIGSTSRTYSVNVSMADSAPATVPEPAVLSVYGAGFAGLGLLVARRRRQNR